MKSPQVLIVDDSRLERQILKILLESMGMRTIEAEDGSRGISLARQARPELIISDILMPGMDGFQFLRILRNTPELSGCRFIFYSAVHTGSRDHELALDLGADGFIDKPKSPEQFRVELQNILTRSQPPHPVAELLHEDRAFWREYGSVVTRKLQEKVAELARSEERFRAMVENTSDWLWEFDKDGLFTYVSPRVRQLLGYEPEELLGKNAFAIMSPEEALRVEKVFAPLAEAHLPFSGLINVNLHKDGHSVIIESSGNPIFTPAGEFTGYRGVDRDVTARIHIERDLQKALCEAEQSRDQLGILFRSMAESLVVTDRNLRITMLNTAAEGLFGRTLQEVSGQPIDRLVSDEAFLKSIGAVMEGSSSQPVDLVLVDQSRNEARTFQARSSMSSGRGDSDAVTITILRDVTAERESDRIKSEFIATAAHELSTPLASIMGYSELLLAMEDLSRSQQKDFLTIIHEKSAALGKIIDELLDLSRIETGRSVHLDRSSCDINLLIRQQVEEYRQESDRHPFELCLPEQSAILFIDGFKISRVLDNLFSNAVKYSPGGGTIRVAADWSDDSYRVCVSDEGIGMTGEQLDKIFDKFYRADSSDVAVRGLGLGMSIAKSIIEAHGGTIRAESIPGQGSTICFTLPVPKPS